MLSGERRSALVVGVVAAPHELVDADGMPRRRVLGSGLAHTHPAVLLEVLRGGLREDVLVGVAHLTGATGLADLLERGVEPAQQRRQPRASHLRHDELEVREALEHARQQQLQERAL
jgi:hypothetical protein